MKRIIIFIALAIGITIGLYAWLSYHKPHVNLENSSPDFILSVADLYEEYEADETAADAKFIGKIIEITGTIDSVDEDQKNSQKIIMSTGDPLSEIQCEMSEKNIVKVNNGEEITLRCICTGKLMDIVLNKCVLIKNK